MIDTQGNVTMGKPRRGHQTVEYARVKAQMVELMDQEIPDPEIAAIMGITRATFWQLKKRVLREIIDTKIAERVAAREYMRLQHQETQLVRYLNSCWAADVPPDAVYIGQFVNLSKRISELIGADAAIAIQVEHVDSEHADQTRTIQLENATALNRFYELAERVAADGIGSGLTKEERERELANMVAALGPGLSSGSGDSAHDNDHIVDAEVVEDEADTEEMVVIEQCDPDHPDDFLEDEEMVDIEVLSVRAQIVATREVASGQGDAETPGRWIAGKWVSWWHELGSNDRIDDDAYEPYLLEDASADLDD
jgi:hypothetical protein